ncbi:alpha/beta fold hydrolase [Clavibacter zhangzhiyongii]|uniref:alpha/beta fold hydrolase n=1 Tax=Clavibacter zhangzhiyongii TaxID=2768071 RepID=UPI0039E15C0E
MTVPSPYAAQLDRIPVVRRTVDLLGSRTAWWEYGPADAAQVVVVVHGFRGDHHGLEPVVAQLPGVRILSPDLPGFGDSTPLGDARHDIPGYAAWLRAFVDATGTRDATVLGHSFGSIVVAAALAGRAARSARDPREPHRGARARGPPGDPHAPRRALLPRRRPAARAGGLRPAAQPRHRARHERGHGEDARPRAPPLDQRPARPVLQRVQRPPRRARGVPRVGLLRREHLRRARARARAAGRCGARRHHARRGAAPAAGRCSRARGSR